MSDFRKQDRRIYILCTLLIIAIAVPTWQSFQSRLPIAESMASPVVIDWAADRWIRTDGGAMAAIYADKVRGKVIDGEDECTYVKGQTILGDIRNPSSRYASEVKVSFVNDATPDSTRQGGLQFFGWWDFDVEADEAVKDGALIRLKVQHMCRIKSGAPRHRVVTRFRLMVDFPD